MKENQANLANKTSITYCINWFTKIMSMVLKNPADCCFSSFRVLDGLFKLSSELFGITIKVCMKVSCIAVVAVIAVLA